MPPFFFIPFWYGGATSIPKQYHFLDQAAEKKKNIYIYIYLILGVHPKKKTFSQLGLSVSLQIWDERAKR